MEYIGKWTGVVEVSGWDNRFFVYYPSKSHPIDTKYTHHHCLYGGEVTLELLCEG